MTFPMRSQEMQAYHELVSRIALIKQVRHKIDYAKSLIQRIEDECEDFRTQLYDMQDRLMEQQEYLETLSHKE